MKLVVKKVYCPTCLKLVKAREEQTGTNIHVVCSRCKNAIWTKENSDWRYIPVEQ